MKKSETLDLTSRKKAAIILTLLGDELAAKVIKYLSDEQVEQLSLEVARLDRVSPEQKEVVITEFHDMATAQDYITEGGINQAKQLLEKAFGKERSEALAKRIVKTMEVMPFEFLRKADPNQLPSFIENEHPQTIALILSYMPLAQAATVLTKLPSDLRAEVAERIAMIDQTPPEVIRKVEEALEKKVSGVISQEMAKAGGPQALVDLLNRVDRSTEKMILESLTESNPELATTVKDMMFVFEDIVQLDDQALQAVLKQVDLKDLGLALKNVSESVSSKIYSNMSERSVGMLKEEIGYMGKIRLRVVEEAQQKIVAVIRQLEESGEVTLSHNDTEDVLV